MAQGQRWDPKTKTGWKFENGKSNYYVNGKKLNTLSILRKQAGEVFAPLTSGAKTIRDKMTRDSRSPIGDSVFEHNKKLLAIKKEVDKNSNNKTKNDTTVIDNGKVKNTMEALNNLSMLFIKDPETGVANVGPYAPGHPDGLDQGYGQYLQNRERIAEDPNLGPLAPDQEGFNNYETYLRNKDLLGIQNQQTGNPDVDFKPTHKNQDVAPLEGTGRGALQIQKKLMDAGFTQSELNALQQKHRDKKAELKVKPVKPKTPPKKPKKKGG